ncbi:hypothetical protein MTO96_010293 [Rhipicephalus appendiculatus]
MLMIGMSIRKRTRAGSDSDEPAGPPKQAVTIAAEPPVLGDAAGVRVEQETSASVPAATTLPPRKGRRRRRTRGHWTRPSSFLPHNIAGAPYHTRAQALPVSMETSSPCPCLTAGTKDPGLQRAASKPVQPLQPAETASMVDQPAAPTDTPAEDLRDIVIGGLLTVLQAVIEYLPEVLPLRDACLKAVVRSTLSRARERSATGAHVPPTLDTPPWLFHHAWLLLRQLPLPLPRLRNGITTAADGSQHVQRARLARFVSPESPLHHHMGLVKGHQSSLLSPVPSTRQPAFVPLARLRRMRNACVHTYVHAGPRGVARPGSKLRAHSRSRGPKRGLSGTAAQRPGTCPPPFPASLGFVCVVFTCTAASSRRYSIKVAHAGRDEGSLLYPPCRPARTHAELLAAGASPETTRKSRAKASAVSGDIKKKCYVR